MGLFYLPQTDFHICMEIQGSRQIDGQTGLISIVHWADTHFKLNCKTFELKEGYRLSFLLLLLLLYFIFSTMKFSNFLMKSFLNSGKFCKSSLVHALQSTITCWRCSREGLNLRYVTDYESITRRLKRCEIANTCLNTHNID